jgi:hypothetical protein
LAFLARGSQLSLHQFKSQLPSGEFSGTLQGLDRHVALCLENPIDLGADK